MAILALANPSLETDLASWVAGTGTTLTRVTTDGWDGTACGRILSNQPTATVRVAKHSLWPVTPGDTLSLSAYVKWDTGATPRDARVRLEWFNGATSLSITAGGLVSTNTSTWVRPVLAGAVAPATATHAEVQVGCASVISTEAFLFDAVQLESGGAVTAYAGGTPPPPPPGSGINVLTNTSAETDTAGWAPAASSTLARGTGDGFHGTAHFVLGLTLDGTRNNQQIFSPASLGATGDPWTGSVYFKWQTGTPKSCRVNLDWLDAAGAQVAVTAGTNVVPSTTGWTRATATGTVPATATQIRFKPMMAAGVVGDLVRWDAAQLETGTEATTYVPPNIIIDDGSVYVRSVSEYDGASAQTHVVTLPADIEDGDALYMAVAQATSTATITPPAGWTARTAAFVAGHRCRLLTATGTAAMSGTTVDVGLSAAWPIAAVCAAFANINPTAMLGEARISFGAATTGPKTTPTIGGGGDPVQVGTLASYADGGATHMNETSGITASRQHPGIYWVHDDGGTAAENRLNGINEAGDVVHILTVSNLTNAQWEDCCMDSQNRIWVGSIGNNAHSRTNMYLFRVNEPTTITGSPGSPSSSSVTATSYPFRYNETLSGGGTYNAECLMIRPSDDRIFIVIKQANCGLFISPATLSTSVENVFTRVADLAPTVAGVTYPDGTAEGLVTCGDWAQDGHAFYTARVANAYKWDPNTYAFLEVIDTGGGDEAMCVSADSTAIIHTGEGQQDPIWRAPLAQALAELGVELSVVADSRDTATPNTTSWTPPAGITRIGQAFFDGADNQCSVAMGHGLLAGSQNVGGRTWTPNQPAVGSAQTFALQIGEGSPPPPWMYVAHNGAWVACTVHVASGGVWV